MRAHNISADRIKVEEFLKTAKKPYSRQEMCEILGIDFEKMGCIISTLRAREKIENISTGDRRSAKYVACYKPKPKPEVKPDVAPPIRYVPREPLKLNSQTPARVGATDHESIPSRRADGYKPHMPMMLMGSSVRGVSGG